MQQWDCHLWRRHGPRPKARRLGQPTKTTARDEAKIVELHAAGQSLSKIAAQFGIGKATVHSIVKDAKAAAQAPATCS